MLAVIVVAAVVAAVAVLVGCTSRKTEHRIGVVLSLTGKGATYGTRALNGMQLAVDELNQAEQFRNQPLRLFVEDSQSLASQALTAFRKLIDVDRVAVVIGMVLSDEVLTCAPVANERKVVILSTAAGSDEIKDAGDYVFRNRESARLQATTVADVCVNRFEHKQVGILYSNAANGISYRDSFKAEVEHLGGQVTVSVGYNEGKTDYRAEIEQLRKESPPAVYLAGLDHELGLILKQSREVGFSPQFFSSAGAISPKLLEIAGAGAEGLVCGSAPFDEDAQDPRVRSFTSAFKTRFGEAPDFIAANSYDAVYILADILKDGARSGEEIRTALYSTRDFPGVGGQTTFDRDGEVTKPIGLVVVRGGRFTRVEER